MQLEKTMFALTLVLICVLAGAAGQILWKEGMSGMGRINGMGDLLQVKTVWDIFANKFIILGIILYAISVFLWLGAMSTLDVSFMYPLLSLGYIATAILAFSFHWREHHALALGWNCGDYCRMFHDNQELRSRIESKVMWASYGP